jgi:protein phosphatase
VICEEKHMGSRAVVIVCRDEGVVRTRFGVVDEGAGICYTRTGRRFFDDSELEAAFVERVRSAADSAGLFDELATDWLLLDCELMPWSAKAQQLLREQYAAVGAAGRAALAATIDALEQASSRRGTTQLAETFRVRLDDVVRYTDAYRRYCWPVDSLTDLKLAPFHLLASENAVYIDKAHSWHMQQIGKLVAEDDELLRMTANVTVDTTDHDSEAMATTWWNDMTSAGGEGMVVKPMDFVARGRRGLAQPALKVRGREYLRIIYGPEYAEPQNLDRLRNRSLGAKRSLAVREFALGIEALDRFVRKEPLRRVHECCFGVLALESEPVDPRL